MQCYKLHAFLYLFSCNYRSALDPIIRKIDKKTGDIKGVLRVHVHFYEDGNVQLQSKKEILKKVNSVDNESIAKIIKLMSDAENEYQVCI